MKLIKGKYMSYRQYIQFMLLVLWAFFVLCIEEQSLGDLDEGDYFGATYDQVRKKGQIMGCEGRALINRV